MINSFIIIDLEWNTCQLSDGSYLNEIIEFGGVRLNSNLEICDTFQLFVKPTFSSELSPMVKRLTHITNEDLALAPRFQEAYKTFCEWVDDTDVLLSFGNADILVMLENFSVYNMPMYIQCMDGYADMQLYCQNMMNIDTSNLLGLTPMAEKLGIDIDDMSMHRALDDCKVSAKCFQKLYNEEEFLKYISDNTSEFYARIQFKNTYTTNLFADGINRADLHLKCPECGCYLKRFEDWYIKNGSLRAKLFCGNCEKPYSGKVRLRIEYDGIKVKGAVSEFNIQSEKSEKA